MSPTESTYAATDQELGRKAAGRTEIDTTPTTTQTLSSVQTRLNVVYIRENICNSPSTYPNKAREMTKRTARAKSNDFATEVVKALRRAPVSGKGRA